MREMRCFLAESDGDSEVSNSWAGTSGTGKIGPFWSLRAVVDGKVDGRTGYLCGLKDIDEWLRGSILPFLRKAAGPLPASIAVIAKALIELFPTAVVHCPKPAALQSLELRVSPYLHLAVINGDEHMVRLTQSFEFSASHRLYVESLSEEDNQRVFGKCANPNGHGHNYIVEVTIRGTPEERTGNLIELPQLESIVKERVIDRFDHKHLNLDCVEFQALNPSVENITRVIWQRLVGALDDSMLDTVRVWETAKTYAEYCGGE